MNLEEEVFNDFLVEMKERLETLEKGLGELEVAFSDSCINGIFRDVHTIKGGAGFFNLTNITDLAHAFEDQLMEIREGSTSFDQSLLPTYYAALDLFRQMLESADYGAGLDVSEFCSKLRGASDQAAALVESATSMPETATVVEGSSPASVHSSENEAAPAPPRDPQPQSQPVPVVEASSGATSQTKALSAPAESSTIKPPAQQTTAANDTIRVRVDLLDRLMELTGEIVVGRNQLLRQFSDTRDKGHLMDMAHLVSDLQQVVLQTRMQPIGSTFTKFRRIVRELSSQLNKPIKLDIRGDETELDRTIIESLSDPLTHLIRNCADHGIEDQHERLAAGKDASGTICLEAKKEGGQVVISVRDDGRGIDTNKVKAKAVKNGLISHADAEKMRDAEANKLIFSPGFSTADAVTGLSGRGVGMDVVKVTLEKLGGTIDVDTTLGAGTQIVVHLPTTLMIMASIIVVIDDDLFAVPISELKEVILVNRADEVQIETIMGKSVFRLRGELIPILTLQDLDAGQMEPEQSDHENHVLPGSGYAQLQSNGLDHSKENLFLVLKSGATKFGLIIDEIHHTEEIVVKPIAKILSHLAVYAGSSILGDSNVAMVLSANGISKSLSLDSQALGEFAERSESPADLRALDLQERQDLLVFSYALGEQLAIPLSLVHKVERIQREDIEAVADNQFITLDGKNLLLVFLDKYLGLKQLPEELDTFYVIMPKIENFEIALVASSIEESVHMRLAMDKPPIDNDAILGVTKIADKTTFILDLFSLAEKVSPGSFTNNNLFDSHAAKRLLVVDDTPFYRDLEKKYFTSAGFNVMLASNGKEALDMLLQDPLNYDLVVTDIVMPIMDGYELVKSIKSSEKINSIPVVALTSFYGEEHEAKALAAGFDGYSVKTNKESIISAVDGFLLKTQARS